MRWLKIVLRDKKEFSFPEYKVEAILNSPDQLVRVYNKRNAWTGVTINKADIAYTEIDKDATRQWSMKTTPELPETTE